MTRIDPATAAGTIVEESLFILLGADLAHTSLQICCDGEQLVIWALRRLTASGGGAPAPHA